MKNPELMISCCQKFFICQQNLNRIPEAQLRETVFFTIISRNFDVICLSGTCLNSNHLPNDKNLQNPG